MVNQCDSRYLKDRQVTNLQAFSGLDGLLSLWIRLELKETLQHKKPVAHLLYYVIVFHKVLLWPEDVPYSRWEDSHIPIDPVNFC